jgi:hypothetical protein
MPDEPKASPEEDPWRTVVVDKLDGVLSKLDKLLARLETEEPVPVPRRASNGD